MHTHTSTDRYIYTHTDTKMYHTYIPTYAGTKVFNTYIRTYIHTYTDGY